MVRRSVKIIVVLLDILTVIALTVGQAEKPLLQDRVLSIPQRQRETQPLLLVADARQTVLAPAIRTAACMVMGKVTPCVSIIGVVFPHRAPLAFAKVRSPEGIVQAGQRRFGRSGHGPSEQDEWDRPRRQAFE